MCIDVLKFSVDDLSSIGAACATMSMQLLKEAECDEDYKEAAHLAALHFRIDSALQMAAKAVREQREHDKEEN